MSRRWAAAWRGVLEDAGPDLRLRLARGRMYERSGRVVDVRVEQGLVTGRVQGSRSTPYAVRVEVPLLGSDGWDRTIAAVAGQARHSARLLAGLAPEGLERELEADGVRLFPRPGGLRFSCECADTLAPCAHAVALWEAAGERLVDDPGLLWRTRGRGRQQLLADVAAARQAAHTTSAAAEHLPLDEVPVDGWWNAAGVLEDVVVPAGDRPATPAPALRIAGDPPGWAGGVGAWDLLRPWIERAAVWAEGIADEG